MENKVSRPFLLTGSIIALIVFVIITISSAYIAFIGSIAGGLSESLGGATEESQLVVGTIIFVAVLLMAFSICGIVFSSISIARWRLDPEQFDKKKGIITTTFVFCVIVAVLELFGLFSQFNILDVVVLIALIVSAVFIMIDRNKNKKLLEAEKAKEEINVDEVNQDAI